MGRPGLDRHPKFRRLVLMLGESRAIARGSLELLWDTAYECGNPSIGESVDVELACDWRGEPGKLCRAAFGVWREQTRRVHRTNRRRTRTLPDSRFVRPLSRVRVRKARARKRAATSKDLRAVR